MRKSGSMANKTSEFIGSWKDTLSTVILYYLSLLVPRRRDLWIFGSWFGYRYSDNSRYLFEYVQEYLPAIRALWLSRDPEIVDFVRRQGREAYLVDSWRAYWLSCRAGLVIVSINNKDVGYWGISRAKKINLWHGSPLKKIIEYEEQIISIPSYRIDKRLWHFFFNPIFEKKYDLIIATSPVFSRRMASCFRVDPSRVHVTGYPRNDILLHAHQAPNSEIEALRQKISFEKVLLYAPTWRIHPEDNAYLFETLNADDLISCLNKHNAVMLVKMHYLAHQLELADKFNVQSSRLHWLPEDKFADFTALLGQVDILITDYSGAYFDFLLLNRPIVFAPFDLDKYSAEQGLYEDYAATTPGPKCANWEEVVANLDRILGGIDDYEDARLEACKKYNTFHDSLSSSRVADMALELVGLKDLTGTPPRPAAANEITPLLYQSKEPSLTSGSRPLNSILRKLLSINYYLRKNPQNYSLPWHRRNQ